MAGHRPVWGSRPPSGAKGQLMERQPRFDIAEAKRRRMRSAAGGIADPERGIPAEIGARLRAMRETAREHGEVLLPPLLILGTSERVGSNWISDTLRPVLGQHNEPFRQQLAADHPLSPLNPPPRPSRHPRWPRRQLPGWPAIISTSSNHFGHALRLPGHPGPSQQSRSLRTMSNGTVWRSGTCWSATPNTRGSWTPWRWPGCRTTMAALAAPRLQTSRSRGGRRSRPGPGRAPRSLLAGG